MSDKNSIDAIWEGICEEIKKRVPEVTFNCFFKDLNPVNIDNGAFVISVNNEYMRGFIEDNYTPLLSDVINKFFGIPFKPHIILDSDDEDLVMAELHGEGLSFEDFFTFDNFILGSTNRFALSAARAVAEKEEIVYNPLLLYGPSGVGKTHLMLAIKNRMKQLFPHKKIAYVRSEDFTNQLMVAVQEGKLGMSSMNEFHKKFRDLDVLLIDDIHFIAGKEATQEEFFNTFNTLYQNNKQIVVTLDRPLKEIKTLDDRIKSRLSAGLTADISYPDYETRVGIIKEKAKSCNIEIEDNLVYHIAENVKSNTRQLEGIVKKLQAYISIQNKIPTIAVVQNFIKDVINDSQPEPIKIETIISEVANTYNVSENDILSNRRTASLARARQVAMYIARETTGLSFKQIGENFGKDHSTVLYNVRQVEEFISDKPYEKALVEDIIKNLKSNNS
ncbi:MAG: chromosomal replication initiator protein DnaA [Clostridia bacterium]|nr:chromosomal replication initiator protein DnaA [Clostridia bacterium]